MRRDEWLLVFVVAMLICCGLVAVHSVLSGQVTSEHHLQVTLAKHILFALVALVALLLVSRIDYHILCDKRAIALLLLSVIVLLILCKFSPLRRVQNGASRWIGRPPFTFQPSEMAKIVVILFMATTLAALGSQIRRLEWALAVCVIPFFVSGLILLEPDFGTAALISAITILMIIVAGAEIPQMIALVHLLALVGIAFVISSHYRLVRITSFWDPFAAGDKGYNLIQSLTGVSLGHVTGVGLGNSVQKEFFLPCASTDFILAIIAEETGALGVGFLTLCYSAFLALGWRIAIKAKETEGRLIAFGITTVICAQALFNMGVALRLLPTKGIPLPFISSGGTSLIVTAATVGILLNVAKQRENPRAEASASMAQTTVLQAT